MLVKMREQETNCRRFDNTAGTRKHSTTGFLNERRGLSALLLVRISCGMPTSHYPFVESISPKGRDSAQESIQSAKLGPHQSQRWQELTTAAFVKKSYLTRIAPEMARQGGKRV